MLPLRAIRSSSWAVESGETEQGLRLAGALTIVWLDQNVAVEGEGWFRTLFEGSAAVDDAVLAKALATASMVAGVRNHFEQAAEWGTEALRYYRAAGSEDGIAWALTTTALIPMELGRPDEAARCSRGRSPPPEGRQFGRFSAASALHSLGDVELGAGEIDAAGAAYRDGLRLAWDTRADRLVCYCLAGLAAVAAAGGDAARAALLRGFAGAYEERLRFNMRGRALYEERLEPVAAAQPERRDAGRRLGVDAAVEIALAVV